MKSGFHGEIGSLPLVDLLQVWSMNHFGGMVTVSSQDCTGQLYFVDGRSSTRRQAPLAGTLVFGVFLFGAVFVAVVIGIIRDTLTFLKLVR
jgi:hypothetical protein